MVGLAIYPLFLDHCKSFSAGAGIGVMGALGAITAQPLTCIFGKKSIWFANSVVMITGIKAMMSQIGDQALMGMPLFTYGLHSLGALLDNQNAPQPTLPIEKSLIEL